MKALLITSLEQFEPWSESYNRLLDKVGGMESLYYATEHLEIPVGVFSSFGIRPFSILVVHDGEVVAGFPFQIQNDWILGLWKTIRFIGDVNTQMGNCYPCILADGFRPDAVDAAVELLKTELAGCWDTMDLSYIRSDDENVRYFISRFEEHYECPSDEEFFYFDASADLDKTLGTKKLTNIRRCLKRLNEDFSSVEIVLKEDISDADVDEIAALHSIRQSGKADGDAFFDSRIVGPIARAMLKLSQGSGHIHYCSLRVDNRSIAMAVNIHNDAVSYGFLTAFDPGFKKYSPSRVLLYHLFKREIEEFGITRIDTSWGASKLKLDFSSGSHKLYDSEIVGRRWKSRAVHGLNYKMETLVNTARRALRPIKRALVHRQPAT